MRWMLSFADLTIIRSPVKIMFGVRFHTIVVIIEHQKNLAMENIRKLCQFSLSIASKHCMLTYFKSFQIAQHTHSHLHWSVTIYICICHTNKYLTDKRVRTTHFISCLFYMELAETVQRTSGKILLFYSLELQSLVYHLLVVLVGFHCDYNFRQQKRFQRNGKIKCCLGSFHRLLKDNGIFHTVFWKK